MLPVELQTPRDIARALAGRVKTFRLDRGWTQQEMAGRTGIALETYRRFERTGRISLERLVEIAVILDAQAGFDRLFILPEARSLVELEERTARRRRKRGGRA